ncbi:hypothetical protein D5086_028704, partial [Populus alba]
TLTSLLLQSQTNQRPELKSKRLYISLSKDQDFVSDFGGFRPIKKSMAEDLVLDTAIRDWVLIPLTVVMILIGILRYFVSKLMQSQQTPDAKIVKEGQVVVRARNLRAGANFIPAKSFRARRAYFSNEENGLLHVPKGQGQNPQAQMFSDPNMAMDMMKKNLSMIIPQTLTFAWVNFFFSGFVAAKIPFPLTQRFRSMLQNGIDLSTVDVSYVSSRSWYFLNLFGLRGLFSLILGEENAMDDTQRMMQMGGFGFDPTKNLSAEKDGLDIIQHEWALPKFEQRAEAVLKKLPSYMVGTLQDSKDKQIQLKLTFCVGGWKLLSLRTFIDVSCRSCSPSLLNTFSIDQRRKNFTSLNLSWFETSNLRCSFLALACLDTLWACVMLLTCMLKNIDMVNLDDNKMLTPAIKFPDMAALKAPFTPTLLESLQPK